MILSKIVAGTLHQLGHESTVRVNNSDEAKIALALDRRFLL
jgi:hypothetical protein